MIKNAKRVILKQAFKVTFSAFFLGGSHFCIASEVPKELTVKDG